MSCANRQQATPDSYPPPPPSSYPPREQAYTAPPPAGYPVKDVGAAQAQQVPVQTKSRGEGFWEGCCAALCCCCVLETCF